MNFLVFSPYYPPHIGGLENHAHEFNLHMAKNGHIITLYTPQIPHTTDKLDTTFPGIRIIRFPAYEIISGYPLPKFWTLLFWKQLSQIKKQSYDIVISRTRFFLTSLMALVYARVFHIRYVHIEHGSNFVHLNSPLYSGLAKLYDYTVGKLIFFGADSVVANSNASAEFVKKITNSAIVPTVIYRGIEPSPLSNKKIIFETAKPIILYSGRLIDGKGVQDLIVALQRIEHQTWTAWIVGDGPYKEKLETMSNALGLQKRIIFWGEQSHTEALVYVRCADIIVNPSYTEGLPTSVIEAARAGKAIIATRVGGTSEIITDAETGLLYSAQDIDMLVGHLRRFLQSEETRNTFGKQALESMNGKFSWEHAMVQYEYVWHNRKN